MGYDSEISAEYKIIEREMKHPGAHGCGISDDDFEAWIKKQKELETKQRIIEATK